MRRFYTSLQLGLTVLLILVALVTVVEADTYRGYETPGYRVTLSGGEQELRQYGPRPVAETRIEASRSQSAGRGFRAVAGYIFGGNAQDQKIAMTSPVAQVPDGEGWRVQFFLPGDMVPDQMPSPDNPDVRLTMAPAEALAVRTFTGRWTDQSLAAEEQALRRWMKAEGLAAIGPARFMFYDAPMTLPWKRRNEVAIPVQP